MVRVGFGQEIHDVKHPVGFKEASRFVGSSSPQQAASHELHTRWSS